MTYSVGYNQVTETEPHKFVSEASDLNFPVGHWPRELTTEIGNKQNFVAVSKKLDADGDIIYVRYEQMLGCVSLKVFND